MPKQVVALGGDGIGPEVIDATVWLLKEMDISGLEIKKGLIGEEAIKVYNTAFPKESRELIDNSDAILFGAVGDTSTMVLAYLRWGLDNFANVRPVKYYDGAPTPIKEPEGIDFVFVRENLEGMYSCIGKEGKIAKLHKKGLMNKKDFEGYGEKAVYGTRIISERESMRVGRFACELAMKRKSRGGPGKLTIVHKSNVLKLQDGLFKDTIYKLAKDEFSELIVDDYYVDDMARRLLRYPTDFDVIVIPNMMGDILSDMTAELVGGLGMAASGLFGPKTPYFEPIHGSAPKYAGLGVANPIATILSAQIMLDYLGFEKEAKSLEDGVASLVSEAKDVEKNWASLPRDLVPDSYREQNKFAGTKRVAEEIFKRM